MPTAATGSPMVIALHRAGLAQNGRRARRISLQYLIIDRFAVVGAVGGHRTDRILDLIQQVRQGGDVADIIRRDVSVSTARCSLRQRRRERIPCF
jgi:hypothetical protein